MSMLQKRLLLILLLLLFLFLLFRFITKENETQTTPLLPITQQVLSDAEYKTLQTNLEEIVTKQNPTVALTTLRESSSSNAAIARECHSLAHTVGRDAYQKYHDFGKALQYQDDVCNSGYLHGVIENYFADTQDILATMKTVCQNYDPQKFSGWECYHGVGHGLMYFTQNTLPRSVKLCESYPTKEARDACVNGVFMENFNTDQKIHPSRYLKATDPFYPCQTQNAVNKSDCYLYAPTFYLSIHKNHYTQTLTWCHSAEKQFQLSCARGVGTQAMKDHITNPKYVESVCLQEKDQFQAACVMGMVDLYINHFGRLDEAKALCPKLQTNNKYICEQLIASEKDFF